MLSITTIRALDSDRLKHALKQALDRLLKQAKELPRAAKYGLLTCAARAALQGIPFLDDARRAAVSRTSPISIGLN